MNSEAATRPPSSTMYWSIRREVWENRSVYIAPLIVAAVVLFGSFLSTAAMSRSFEAKKSGGITTPIQMAPAPIMLATFLVGFFYSFDALYGERRDRSILFWKSLPVSDRTTVLAQASIPLLVLPAIAIVLSFAAVLILLPITAAVMLSNGMSWPAFWGEVPSPFLMVYGMAIHAVWFAPIHGWLLLVGAWARRAPLLWAVLPPLMIAMLERAAFGTTYFGNMLRYRFLGAMTEGFVNKGKDQHPGMGIEGIDPLNYLLAPGLWVGLAFAAACIAAAVRLRRNREPI